LFPFSKDNIFYLTVRRFQRKAENSNEHRTTNLIAHAAKRVARLFRRRIEKKIEKILALNLSGFTRGKELWMPFRC
jgi:hypothetical protein